MAWDLFILAVLIVSLLGAMKFGETTARPLWVAGLVPALWLRGYFLCDRWRKYTIA